VPWNTSINGYTVPFYPLSRSNMGTWVFRLLAWYLSLEIQCRWECDFGAKSTDLTSSACISGTCSAMVWKGPTGCMVSLWSQSNNSQIHRETKAFLQLCDNSEFYYILLRAFTIATSKVSLSRNGICKT